VLSLWKRLPACLRKSIPNDVTDEEEVELSLGSGNTLNRKMHRRFREFKYYYLENKLFINVIIIGLMVLGLGIFVVNKEVINKVYEQGESLTTDNFRFQVLDTFVTNKSYDNKVILNNDNTFVVIRMAIASNDGKRKLNTSNLILDVNYNSYSSDSYYGARFSDLGNAYSGDLIGSASTYLFIYKINKEDANKKMKIVYAGDKTINLNSVILDEVKDAKKYKLEDNIDLATSSLGSGRLKINSMELAEKFSYTYQYEIGGKMYNSQLSISSVQKIIMHLKIEASYPYGLDNYSFLERYGKLKYKKDETEYVVSFNNRTPGDYKGGLYLSVDKALLDADSIWFEIQIRNQQYIYTLK